MGSDLFLLLASSQPPAIDGAGKAVEAAVPGGQPGGFLNFLEAVLSGVEAKGDIQSGANEDGGKQEGGEKQEGDGPDGIPPGFPLAGILPCNRQSPPAPPPDISAADGPASVGEDAGSAPPVELAGNSPAYDGSADPSGPVVRGNAIFAGAHLFPTTPGRAGIGETGSSAAQPEVPPQVPCQPFAGPPPAEVADSPDPGGDSPEIQAPQPHAAAPAAFAAPPPVVNTTANSETSARDLPGEPGPGAFLNIVAPEKTVPEKARSGEQKSRSDVLKSGLDPKDAPDRKREHQQAASPDPKWEAPVPVPQAPGVPETPAAPPEAGGARKPATGRPSTAPQASAMPPAENAAQPPALRGEVAFYARLQEAGREPIATEPASIAVPRDPAAPAAEQDPIMPRGTAGEVRIQGVRESPVPLRAVAAVSPADRTNVQSAAAGRAEGGAVRDARNRQDAPSTSAGNKDEVQPAPPRRPEQDARPSSDTAALHAPAGLKPGADAAGHSQPAPVAFHPPVRVSEPATLRQPEAREAGEARPAERPQAEPEGLLPRSSEPVRDISLRISDAGQERVEVRLANRAGEMKVAVRTPDAELAGSLRAGLSDLVQRLEHSGFHAEAWTPGRQPSSSGLERGTSDFADPQGGRQHGHPDGRQQKHQNQRQANWVEENDEDSPERRSLEWSQLVAR